MFLVSDRARPARPGNPQTRSQARVTRFEPASLEALMYRSFALAPWFLLALVAIVAAAILATDFTFTGYGLHPAGSVALASLAAFSAGKLAGFERSSVLALVGALASIAMAAKFATDYAAIGYGLHPAVSVALASLSAFAAPMVPGRTSPRDMAAAGARALHKLATEPARTATELVIGFVPDGLPGHIEILSEAEPQPVGWNPTEVIEEFLETIADVGLATREQLGNGYVEAYMGSPHEDGALWARVRVGTLPVPEPVPYEGFRVESQREHWPGDPDAVAEEYGTRAAAVEAAETLAEYESTDLVATPESWCTSSDEGCGFSAVVFGTWTENGQQEEEEIDRFSAHCPNCQPEDEGDEDEGDEDEGAPGPAAAARSQARAQLDSILDVYRANLAFAAGAEEVKDEDGDWLTDGEELDRANEFALSVQVRSGWQDSIGEEAQAEEYKILLCTGGPAVQIVGKLGAHFEPETATLQYQDWFTPWHDFEDVDSEDRAALLWYAGVFHYG